MRLVNTAPYTLPQYVPSRQTECHNIRARQRMEKVEEESIGGYFINATRQRGFIQHAFHHTHTGFSSGTRAKWKVRRDNAGDEKEEEKEKEEEEEKEEILNLTVNHSHRPSVF